MSIHCTKLRLAAHLEDVEMADVELRDGPRPNLKADHLRLWRVRLQQHRPQVLVDLHVGEETSLAGRARAIFHETAM